ncbi:hypothetical protein SLEP1_g2873 [Rubroshorea leprosula]|uniref:Uncharacterized protein n=1 Tax=Rubroshorea leprosula TaxID=152421 RepID=A0AAV5HQW3_9ROSI|nr:hypothetical protein SLEP1_g2873 [Rubroshorea leprosula]
MGTNSEESILLHGDLENHCSESLRQVGEHFNILLAHPVVDLELKIKEGSKVRGGKGIKGTVKIPARRIITGEIIREWYPVEHVKGDRCKNLDLDIEMKFTPCDQNPLYDQGIAGDPEQAGMRNTYFPLREGNKVKLYQDAHVPEEMSREIELLVREPTRPLPRGGDLTLGELLKSKSEERVQVVVLIWDDKTSYDIFGIEMRGVMRTHDEETRKFFEDSSVICKLVHRQASKSHNFFTRASLCSPYNLFQNLKILHKN